MLNFQEHYFSDSMEFIALVNRMLKEEDDFTASLNPQFVSRLSNYLEKGFPSFGDFNTAVGVELRKYMQGDNDQIRKMQRKIHNIINKAKEKFLHGIQAKCEKILVVPKDQPTVVDEPPIEGDSSPDEPKLP
jgi:hypothetical protein